MSAVTSQRTEFAVSADGTRIAFERRGQGPLLVLVDGALCSRAFGPARQVAAAFEDAFTVVAYDRRGRGESGDTAPYDVAREVDDLAAVIDAAGGQAAVLGQSSGGALALEAAAAGVPMRRLAVYEAPYVGLRRNRDGSPRDYHGELAALLDAGERGKAVDYFMVKMVKGPAFLPLMFRLMRKPWAVLRATAHTLRYDAAVMGSGFTPPTERLARIATPTLVMCGGKAAPEMADAQRQVASAVPGAAHRMLPGQTHQVSPAALRAAVAEFIR